MIAIYTTYLANLKNLPEHIAPVAICGKRPDRYSGLTYPKLAPKYSFFKMYKDGTINELGYEKFYIDLVLHPLNPTEVVTELALLSNNRDIALWCYEKPNDFCHRHIVSKWLSNFNVKEYM